jgi:hypothetical protein
MVGSTWVIFRLSSIFKSALTPNDYKLFHTTLSRVLAEI